MLKTTKSPERLTFKKLLVMVRSLDLVLVVMVVNHFNAKYGYATGEVEFW